MPVEVQVLSCPHKSRVITRPLCKNTCRGGGMADALDLGSSGCKPVEVQVLSSAPTTKDGWRSWLARLFYTEKAGGSNPSPSTGR
jgi:hypothetical protein